VPANSRRPRAALLLALLAAACGAPAHDQGPCLPPVYEGGQRLHGLPGPTVFDLDLLLRQHELCWRRPARDDEARVVLLGSSAVYGFPLFADESLAARLNVRLAQDDVAAHVFNAAFVNPDQVRDALILDAVLPYRPDVIVYPLTPAEFAHFAPALYLPVVRFFTANLARLERLTQAPPAGLEEPFERYRAFVATHRAGRAGLRGLAARARDLATLVRSAVRERARAAARALTGAVAPAATTHGRQDRYECDKTVADNRRRYADWQTWNGLANLAALQRAHDIPVLLVFWPVAHEPRGACYSVRYTDALMREFGAWAARESAARGLAYLDLHDLLPPELFFDSVHVTPAGQARIADALAPHIAALLARRGAAPARAAAAPAAGDELACLAGDRL